VLLTGCLAFLLRSAGTTLPSAVPQAAESTDVVMSRVLARPRSLSILQGQGWRALWAARVRLPILASDTIGGGAAEIRTVSWPFLGSVILLGRDSLAYRIIPADRTPAPDALPPNLRHGNLARLLSDLVATNHPSASLVASGLYGGAGLDALTTTLAVLPADSALPASLIQLEGRAVWLERAPDLDGQAYGKFARVIRSDSMLALLREHPEIRLDLPRLVAARLVDLMLGDRDRSPAHWLWGLRHLAGGDSIWTPIAMRQEEALLHADGWSRVLLSIYQPGYGILDARMPDVRGLSMKSSDFDRPLLARLEKPVWDSVAGALRAALTDDVIASAVQAMPAAHHLLSGAHITRVLLARRDRLGRIARALRRLGERYADIELSDLSEDVTVARHGHDTLDLRVTVDGRETLHRVFRHGETEEIRLHLRAGDDRVLLQDVEHTGVGVRITSSSGGVHVIREGNRTRRIVLYAARDSLTLSPEGAVRIVPGARGRWLLWQREGLPPTHPDWGLRLDPIVELSITQDLGVLLGGGAQATWYGFGEPAYRQRFRIAGSYASTPSAFAVAARFERRDVLPSLHLTLDLRASDMEVVRYLGYGNTTSRARIAEFYRARGRVFAARAAVAWSRSPEFEFRLGPVLSLGNFDTSGARTLFTTEQPYGSGRFDMAGLEARLQYAPSRARYQPGIAVQVGVQGTVYPALLDVHRGAFGVVGSELRVAWVPREAGRTILASRLGGTWATGTVPFRLAPRLGGPATLRGFQTDRFVGNRASVFGSMEFRVRAFRLRSGFLKGDVGMLAFGDAGRVWQQGESSRTIHTGWGGGVWMAPALGWIPGANALMARLELARSREGTMIAFGSGFQF
jgi:hypothetical protein